MKKSRRPFYSEPGSRVLRFESLEKREYLAADPAPIGFVSPENALLAAADAVAESPSTIVTTARDLVDPCDGLVSLREAIAYAPEGAAITFDAALQGETITLDGAELVLDKSMTIDASALYDAENNAPGITIDAAGASRIFTIDAESTALVALAMTNGTALSDGGAILLAGGSLAIQNSLFTRNLARGNGGAIAADALAALTIDASAFRGNTAQLSGGALFIDGTDADVANSLFAENNANNGGAIYAKALDAVNCTITANATSDGGALAFGGAGVIRNTILVENAGSDLWLAEGTKSWTLVDGVWVENAGVGGGTFSAWNSLLAQGGAPTAGENNLLYDPDLPLFADPQSGDYALARDSQAINKGDAAYVVGTADLTGSPRVNDGAVDLGAYESAETSFGAIAFRNHNPETGALTVSWPKLDDADYYRLELSTDAGRTWTVVAASLANNYKTVSGIDAYCRYDYRVTPLDAQKTPLSRYALGTFDFTEPVSLVVDSLDDILSPYDGRTTLRDAIAYASDGAVITFADSLAGRTLMLAGTPIAIDKTLTIDAGATGIALDAGALSRVLEIRVDDDARTDDVVVTLMNLTIQNGVAVGSGGGIYACSPLALVNCVVKSNAAEIGAGICADAPLTLENTLVVGNRAGIYGGGVHVDGATLTLLNVAVARNCARYGGGICVGPDALLDAYNSVLAINDADDDADNDVCLLDDPQLHGGGADAHYVLSGFERWSVSQHVYLFDAAKPLFSDPDAGDYSLAMESQAINKGNNDYVDAEADLAGNERVLLGVVDLGPYEASPDRAGNLELCVGTVNVRSFDPATGNVMFGWDRVDGASGYSVNVSADDGKTWTIVDANVTNNYKQWTGVDGYGEYIVRVDALDSQKNRTGQYAQGVLQYAEAPSLLVDTTDDLVDPYDGRTSLREAIAAANDGGVVEFAPGIAGDTIRLQLGAIVVDKALAIDAGAAGITIDAHGASRVLELHATDGGDGGDGSDGAVSLVDITLRNGWTEGNGAGIYAARSLDMNSCTVVGAVAENGAGIYLRSASLAMTNCVVVNNDAFEFGGAIYMENADAELRNVTIAGNTAYAGGGCVVDANSTLDAYNSIIAGNAAGRTAGDVRNLGTVNVRAVLSDDAGWAAGENNDVRIRDASLPLFADPDAGDYSLALDSQALNLGVNEYVGAANDRVGELRVIEGVVDLGAYEFFGVCAGTITVRSYERSTGVVMLAWDRIVGASYYSVEKSTDGGLTWTAVGASSANAYKQITGITELGEYLFRVKALDANRTYTRKYAAGSLEVAEEAVAGRIFIRSRNRTTGVAMLGWDAIDGASYYALETSDDGGITWTSLGASSANLYKQVSGVAELGARLYRVKALNDSREYMYQYVMDTVDFTEARSLVVNTTDDRVDPYDDLTSLREAIRYADDGDAITFDPSIAGETITLAGEPLLINKSITIDGGIGGTAIDANGDSRVFELHASAADDGDAPAADHDDASLVTTFLNLTITGGAADYGAGIETERDLVMTNCVVVNNVAEYDGGGLEIAAAHVALFNCTIANNSARDGGGCFLADGSVLDVCNSLVALNDARWNPDVSLFETEVNGAPVAYARCVLSGFDAWTDDVGTNYLFDPTLPLFADANAGDYSLAHASQAIDRGDNDAVNVGTDKNGAPRIQGGIVDLGAYESASRQTGTISLDAYAPKTGEAAIAWTTIAGAARYSVQISDDDGETWTQCGETELCAMTIPGVNAGNSWLIRVRAIDANGADLDLFAQRPFAPIAVAYETTRFEVGTTINVTVHAAADASYAVAWYAMTLDGEVELTMAANSLSWTPDSDEYNLKVVVTGTGPAAGCVDSVVFMKAALVNDGNITVSTYDPATGQTFFRWEPITGASKYSLLLSDDGGATWTTVGAATTNRYKSAAGLLVGKSFVVRVLGLDADGNVLGEYHERGVVPYVASPAQNRYAVGSAVLINIVAGDVVDAEVRWYLTTEDGDLEITEAAGALSYVPASGEYDLKIVLTGTGNSEGWNVTTTVQKPAEVNDGTITVSGYDPATGQTMTRWEAIDGAVKYSVRISADSGATWTTVGASTANRYKSVPGLTVGGTYLVEITGIDDNGAELPFSRQRTFIPFAAGSETTRYETGKAITVTTDADSDAAVSIGWYAVTADGDVEITEARNSLVYVPTDGSADLKAVLTGVAGSEGCSATLTFARPQQTRGDMTTVASYDPATGQTLIRWEPIPGASKYSATISSDAGSTWTAAGAQTSNRYKSLTNLTPGTCYQIRVEGWSAAGAELDVICEHVFAPIAAESTANRYKTGQTISVAVTPAEAEYEVAWYSVTPTGDVLIEGASGTDYTPTEGDYDLKAVVTGRGSSAGTSAELTFTSPSTPVIGAVTLQKYNAGARQAILQWDEVDDAVSYRLAISKDGGKTWITYANTVTKNSAAVNGIYANHSYPFKVTARLADKTFSASYNIGTIEPIQLVTNGKPYATTTAKNVTLQATTPENVDIRWYYITDDGDVEITEAHNLKSYQLPTSAYEIRVVAIGSGASAGFVSSVNIPRPTKKIAVTNQTGSKATLTWQALPGAETYLVKRSVDNGETWIAYKKDLTAPTCEASGLYSGKTYMFKVAGYDAAGRAMLSTATCTIDRSGASAAVIDEAFADFFADDLSVEL